MIEVAAGVLVDAAGRILLAERPAGKHLAGAWEFPGGKLEAGEDAATALARELAEELGITVEAAVPCCEVTWRYEAKIVHLQVLSVIRWQGEPVGREGQALRWRRPVAIDAAELAPADREILARLRAS